MFPQHFKQGTLSINGIFRQEVPEREMG
jgi:hypothetical protein